MLYCCATAAAQQKYVQYRPLVESCHLWKVLARPTLKEDHLATLLPPKILLVDEIELDLGPDVLICVTDTFVEWHRYDEMDAWIEFWENGNIGSGSLGC